MGLIACPECKQNVSDKAPSCPKCGTPIAATTIEATGKKWKLMQLFGALLVVFGFFRVCAAMSTAASTGDGSASYVAAVMLMVGVVLTIGGRFGAWWNHG